jgi:hypothetical protein
MAKIVETAATPPSKDMTKRWLNFIESFRSFEPEW